jgi:hypothetical protein
VDDKRIDEWLLKWRSRRNEVVSSRKQQAQGMAAEEKIILYEGKKLFREFIGHFEQVSRSNKIDGLIFKLDHDKSGNSTKALIQFSHCWPLGEITEEVSFDIKLNLKNRKISIESLNGPRVEFSIGVEFGTAVLKKNGEIVTDMAETCMEILEPFFSRAVEA